MSKTKIEVRREHLDHKNPENLRFKSVPGLSEEVVRMISRKKREPEWMLKKRLKGLELWNSLPLPEWGPPLEDLDISKITLYAEPDADKSSSWEDVPDDIKRTFERLGIPEAEQKSLAGTGAQYESHVVYHKLKEDLEKKGIIFLDMDEAVKKHPELVKDHFMTTCVPVGLHKFSALHAAVWSGGTFIFVPKGVKVPMPLQAYFRMNAERGGQFEHTLIILGEGAECHYLEGCSAPQYTTNSLHAGCVEIHVKEGARARYSSVENWSKNTYNLNTKRAVVEKNGIMEWVNGNLGSCVTMLYPASVLKGTGARGDYLGIAFAGKGQNQDTGTKVYHLAPNTQSVVRSKSISMDGGVTSYRGLLQINKGCKGSKSSVSCDALMMDDASISNTFPHMKVNENKSDVAHEATVGKISQEQIFYLMSRGLTEEQTMKMIVQGFMEPIVKQLPLEYAVELNRLIELEMEGAVG